MASNLFLLLALMVPSLSYGQPSLPFGFYKNPPACSPGTVIYSTPGGYTFDPPGTCDTMIAYVWGGGGGGGADGGVGRTGGSAGTSSVVNGTITAGGGSGGAIGNGGAGGAGGTASGGDTNLSGTAGSAGTLNIGGAGGAAGGVSAGGGAGAPANDDGVDSTGLAGTAPGGGGAGGEAGSGNAGAGGGGGGAYAFAIISTTSDIPVTVGAGGAGGTLGTANGGAGGNGRVVISWGLDDIASTFDFTDLTNQATSTLVTSNIVQVTGIGASVNALTRVTGNGNPEIRVCADSSCTSVRVTWTTATQGILGVLNNEYIQLRMTSNASVSSTDIISVTLGRTPVVDWSVQTLDQTPDVFNFTDVNPAQPSTLYSSNIVQITGITAAANVSISGDGSPQYRTCSTSDCSSVIQTWTSATNTISNGQYLQLRMTTSATYLQAHNVDVTVGTGAADWDLTNSADYLPNAIDWVNFNDTSSSQTISGVAGPINIQFSVVYDTGTPLTYYRKNGGAWVYFTSVAPATASFTNGDTIEFYVASGTNLDDADITVTNLSYFNTVIDTVRGTATPATPCTPFSVTQSTVTTTNNLVTAGCQFARVRAWGGGGGGGTSASPPPGGTGGYSEKTFTVNQADVIELITAQGGEGGACAGRDGGTGAYAGGAGGGTEAAGANGQGGTAGGSGGAGIDKGANGGAGFYGGGGGGGSDTSLGGAGGGASQARILAGTIHVIAGGGGGSGGEESNSSGAGGSGCGQNGFAATGDDSGGGGGGGACLGTITSQGSAGVVYNSDLASGAGTGGVGAGSCATGTGSNGRIILDVFGDDIYPNTFDFTDQTPVALSTLTTSNIMQITGISVTANVSIRGSGSPQYRTCSDATCTSVIQTWTSSPTTITNNNYVQMRLTSSASQLTALTAFLDVGYREESWVVTTGDATPAVFAFTDSTGNPTSTQTASNILQITGINIPVNVSISGTGSPQYRICSDATCTTEVVTWTNSANQISNNQYLQVRATSSASNNTTINTTVTVGLGNDTWSLTTYDTIPTVFNFTDQTLVAVSTLTTSNILQITGIDTAVSISVSGGGTPEFRTCSDATCTTEIQTWTTTATTISNNQYVQLRMTSNAAPATQNTATLTVGGGSDNWLVTTAP